MGLYPSVCADASPEANPQLDQAAGFAVRYYNDFVKPTKTYRMPTDLEREALIDLRDQLKAWEADWMQKNCNPLCMPVAVNDLIRCVHGLVHCTKFC